MELSILVGPQDYLEQLLFTEGLQKNAMIHDSPHNDTKSRTHTAEVPLALGAIMDSSPMTQGGGNDLEGILIRFLNLLFGSL